MTTTSSPTKRCCVDRLFTHSLIVSRNIRWRSGQPMWRVRAAETAVGVQAVIKGLSVDADDVRLQVALLGGTVGAIFAREWLPS